MKEKNISHQIKQSILKRDNFTCQKCGFQDLTAEEIEIHHINPKVFSDNNNLNNLITLCSICHKYAPDSEEGFINYINEKINGKILNTFRKSQHSIGEKTKYGMTTKFNEGKHITKAPKGYKLVNKELIIDESQANEVKQIFEEFLNNTISLTQLAKNHKITTAGLKKLLQNTTYLGKVKFANQESRGTHKSIINQELFNKVQEKLKNL